MPTSISKKRWLRELREGLWKRLENMAIGKEALSTRKSGKKNAFCFKKWNIGRAIEKKEPIL